ncbi:hypothetical protein EVAR_25307_1 [Eumeta japonica]|uniref:Uncharacterized protein n=1 Tax=Eumeta variegata TaxID=151549 RepID=A0A4C1VRK5_EUMVA|nr:hypothetical protein EVAR_25307_1 [Eumeta japonica]
MRATVVEGFLGLHSVKNFQPDSFASLNELWAASHGDGDGAGLDVARWHPPYSNRLLSVKNVMREQDRRMKRGVRKRNSLRQQLQRERQWNIKGREAAYSLDAEAIEIKEVRVRKRSACSAKSDRRG